MFFLFVSEHPQTSVNVKAPRSPVHDLGYTKADLESEADRLKFYDALLGRESRKEEDTKTLNIPITSATGERSKSIMDKHDKIPTSKEGVDMVICIFYL